MKGQLGVGHIPYEIDDRIVIKNEPNNEYTILDIRMIQYIKEPKIEFEVQLSNNMWVSVNEVLKRII